MNTTAKSPELLLSLPEKVDPRNAAVLVIDVLNDFIAPGGFADKVGWDLTASVAATSAIEGFLYEARQVGVPVVFIRSIYDDIYLSGPMLERNIRRRLEVPRCRTGTWGAELYRLAPLPSEPVVTKHRLSAFVNTDLELILRNQGVRSLLLTGVFTEACIESTGRHGYFLDYYVVLVSDCCATTNQEVHRGALERCEREFGVVASSDEIRSVWSHH